MSWAETIQKNNDEKIKPKNNNQDSCPKIDITNNYPNIYEDYSSQFKDADEEFEYLYSRRISSLKEAFKELIDHQALPFLNEDHINLNYTFYDFIKDSSSNYDTVKKEVDEYNYAIEKEIEEENIKLDIELKEEYDYYH